MTHRLKLRTLLHGLLLVAVLLVVGLFFWEAPWPDRAAQGGAVGHVSASSNTLWWILRVGGGSAVLLLVAAEVVLLFHETVAKKILHLRFLDSNLASVARQATRESKFVVPTATKNPNAGDGLGMILKSGTQAAPKSGAAPLPFAGKTVLIADDDFDISQTLVIRFEKLGMTAMRTSDALQLLFGVHKVKTDLVVLDVNMPTGNGLAVCEMINSDEALAGLPVIVYTGSSAEATIGRCRALGAYYVLKEPNSWTAIEAIVYKLFTPGQRPPSHPPEPTPEQTRSEVPETSEPLALPQPHAPALAEPILDEPTFDEPIRAEPESEFLITPQTQPVAVRPPVPTYQPPSTAELLAAPRFVPPERGIREATGPGGTYRVLAIHVEPELLAALQQRSGELRITLSSEANPERGYWECLSEMPDLVIVGTGSSDSSATDVLLRLKSSPHCGKIPLLAIVGPEGNTFDASAAEGLQIAFGTVVDVQRALRQLFDHSGPQAKKSAGVSAPQPAPPPRAPRAIIIDEPEEPRELVAAIAVEVRAARSSVSHVAPLTPVAAVEFEANTQVDVVASAESVVELLVETLDNSQPDQPISADRPIAATPPEEADSGSDVPAAVSPADEVPPVRQRPLVLVIDDDPHISAAIALRLSTYGVDVLPAFTGMSGYWKAIDIRPDVILCDMRMPDGEGNYVAGRLQSHPLTQIIPVIIITGQDSPGLKRVMMSMGVSAYLSKPINMKELLTELRRHINLPEAPHGPLAADLPLRTAVASPAPA